MADPNSLDELPDELLSAYLDDALSSEERVQVERHLLAHPEAQKQVAQLRAVSSLVRRLPPQPARADLRDAVLKRIEKQQDGTERTVKPKLTIGRSPRGWIWAGLAVAASIALMIYQERSNLNQPNSDIARRSMPGLQNRSHDLEWISPQAGANPENEAFDEIATASNSANKTPTGNAKLLADEQKEEHSKTYSHPQLAESDEQEEELFETASQFAQSADTPILFVHVVMPFSARRNLAFENLLESEGLIDRPDLDGVRELRAANRVLTDQGAPGRFGVGTDDADEKGVKNQKRSLDRVSGKSTDSAAGLAGTPVDPRAEGELRSDGGELVEVIMVEAPEANVLSCLEKLQSDEHNFLAIEVDVPEGQLNSRHAVARRDKTVASQLAADSSWIGLQQFNRGQISPAQRAHQPVKPAVRSPSLAKAAKAGLQRASKLPAAEPSAAKAERKAIARSRLVGDNLVQVVFVLGTTAPPESVSTQPDLREESPGEAAQQE
jgi:hypothetical protein